MNIDQLLHFAYQNAASDLHITVGVAPVVRINGKLKKVGSTVLMPDDTEKMARDLMNEQQQEKFYQTGEIDFSYAIPSICRFRMNVFKQRGSVVIVCRVINSEIPDFADLQLPPVVTSFAKRTQGLLIVTGPTGSGKSTTLASIVNYINTNMTKHVLTLEDPIEYLHSHNKSIVNQREIGIDSASFAGGLRAALRQDPDVILLGEMRDLDTIETALTAAETGHLVLATLHTTGAAQTVDRIIDVFAAEQQPQIRTQLASSLVGVISQQLLPLAAGTGRRAALEILVNNHAVANLIRSNKVHQIQSILETNKAHGMQTMSMSVREFVKNGVITSKTADEFVPNWSTHE